MYADTAAVRALARAMRERAHDLRLDAHLLAARAEEVPWTGLAAEAMRRTSRDRAARLRACADAHDAAADTLEHHAREVDRVREVVVHAAHDAQRLAVSAARVLP